MMIGKKAMEKFISSSQNIFACVSSNDNIIWDFIRRNNDISFEDINKNYIGAMVSIYTISKFFSLGTLSWSSNRIFKLNYSAPYGSGSFVDYCIKNISKACSASQNWFFKSKVCIYINTIFFFLNIYIYIHSVYYIF